MKTWLSCLLLCCLVFLFQGIADLRGQEVGSTEQAVLNRYGPPHIQYGRVNGDTVWSYLNGNRFVISKGLVVRADIPSPDAAPRSVEQSSAVQPPPKSAERPNPPIKTFTPDPQQPKRAQAAPIRDRYEALEHLSGFGLVMLLLGIGILLIGNIWWIVVTFRVSILWGALCLFVPFAGFVFLIVHWTKAKAPLLFSLLGCGLALSGMAVTGLL